MQRSLRHASLLNVLALGTIFVVAGFAGCDNTATTTGTSTNVTVTNGTGYHPDCHGGAPDGFCDRLGADPESCACLDCVDTASCKNACKDDGTCNPGQGEDCTCKDCEGKTIPDGNGGTVTCYQGASNPTTAASTGPGGGSGPGSTTSQASTAQSTSANTSSATTAASTSAATTAASTSAATSASTTDASTTTAAGGG